jgi:hypothetical protein
MRSLIATILLLPTLALAGAGVVDHYDVDLTVLPTEEKIRVEATIKLIAPPDGLSEVELLMNEGLVIESVRCDKGKATFSIDKSRLGVVGSAPKAAPVRIRIDPALGAGKSATLTFHYSGKLSADRWGINRVSRSWIELGHYSAWFPYTADHRDFTYEVDVKIDPAFTLVGAGRSSSREGVRTFVQERRTDDIVILGSRAFLSVPVDAEGFAVTISHVRIPDDQIGVIARDVAHTLSQYRQWFGPPRTTDLEIVFADRSGGGAYDRAGLAVVIYDGNFQRYRQLLKRLGHELAQLWWSGADTTTWEVWLNESFAEYSSFLNLRARGENEMFMAYLGDFEQLVDQPPVLWGMDRDHKYAHDTLHRKGPGLLFRLETDIGSATFMKWLAAVRENDVTTTVELLTVLEKTTSKETRDRFEGYLKGP